jgi:hypothetical protein
MTSERERVDNDSPWKEILEAYFPQAMEFFFPQTAALINWERPHEFLDKEFQQIARDAEQGRRYADKLVKVWQIQGQEIWLLIHVEIQAKPEDSFAERMFSYNLRIFDRFAKPAISLAILCDPDLTLASLKFKIQSSKFKKRKQGCKPLNLFMGFLILNL